VAVAGLASWHTFVAVSLRSVPGAVVKIDDMPAVPLSRRTVVIAAALVLGVSVLVGRHVSRGGTAAPVREPIVPRRAVTARPQTVVVDVVGAVRWPGLYRLREGARVADALRRAGGATRKADVALINLAAPIADGTQIAVPKRGAGSVAVGSAVGAAGSAAGTPAAPAGPVHLNTATLEQLDALPGIGPVTAQKILAYRQKHGSFRSVNDLDAIPGIGPARMDQLRDLVAP
jgi:competence protein ComEA